MTDCVYTTIPRLWPNSTICCVASGPSLTAEDCAYVRGRARVIAVNDGIRLTCDFADLMYGSDYRFWNHYRGYPSYPGPKYALEIRRGAGRQRYEGLPQIRMVRYGGDFGLELKPDTIRSGKNSGAAAINLALHLGASRILLLGYNGGLTKGGRRHFFSDRPTELNLPSSYDIFCRAFDAMAGPLAEAGVSVINCTPHTNLTCFPVASIRDVLASDSVAAPSVEEAVA